MRFLHSLHIPKNSKMKLQAEIKIDINNYPNYADTDFQNYIKKQIAKDLAVQVMDATELIVEERNPSELVFKCNIGLYSIINENEMNHPSDEQLLINHLYSCILEKEKMIESLNRKLKLKAAY